MISVNIATHKARAKNLRKAVDDLFGQNTKPDVINIYFNGYKSVPKWVSKYDNVYAECGTDLGARAKFYFLKYQQHTQHGLYITADDDLSYPPGFVGYLNDACAHYVGCFVGFHGLIYDQGFTSYEHGYTKKIMFSDGLEKDYSVDVLGTGCMAFNVSCFPDFDFDCFEEKNMCDVELANYASESNAPRICLTRAEKWITQQSHSQDSAIWKSVVKDDTKQSKILTNLHQRPNLPRKINSKRLGPANLEWPHIKWMFNNIPFGSKVVQFGSGESNNILNKVFDLVSVENEKEYYDKFVSDKSQEMIYAPIRNGWYKLSKKDFEKLHANYYIIDGPKGDRSAMLEHLDNLNDSAMFIVDDCHREKDRELAEYIALALHKELIKVNGLSKIMYIIK
jgi:hypothetical protein